MLAILYVMVGGAMMLVLVVLAVVVVGIKQEPSAQELSSRAPSATTAWVRRLIGVYVRKPDQSRAFHEDRGEPPITAWNPPPGQEGPRNKGAGNHGLERDITIQSSKLGSRIRSFVPRPPTPDRKEVTAIAGIHGRAGSRDAARRS